MARRKRPLARATGSGERWFAVSRRIGNGCMSSGPWPTELAAQKVADLWNRAADLP